jgi:hypothetical protein
MILSLVAAILVLVDNFGWWYEGGYYYWYGYGIDTDFTPGFHKFLLVLLGIVFLAVLLLSLQQLYPVLKVSKEINDKLGLIGLIVAASSIALTLLITILFYAWSADFTWGSYLTTGFYAGIVGGLFTTLFLFLAMRIDKQKK